MGLNYRIVNHNERERDIGVRVPGLVGCSTAIGIKDTSNIHLLVGHSGAAGAWFHTGCLANPRFRAWRIIVGLHIGIRVICKISVAI